MGEDLWLGGVWPHPQSEGLVQDLGEQGNLEEEEEEEKEG